PSGRISIEINNGLYSKKVSSDPSEHPMVKVTSPYGINSWTATALTLSISGSFDSVYQHTIYADGLVSLQITGTSVFSKLGCGDRFGNDGHSVTDKRVLYDNNTDNNFSRYMYSQNILIDNLEIAS